MAWKQSLAQLKQDLKALEGDAPKAAPPPKVIPKKPEEFKPMEDEDALFLMAMGAKPQAKAPRKVPVAAPAPVVAAAPEPDEKAKAKSKEEDFGEAMASLKGMKSLGRQEVLDKAERPASLPVPVEAKAPPAEPVPMMPEPPVLEPEPEVVQVVPEPESLPAVPSRIQLAAGMAIEVDGVIDLRGHSIADARERIKERAMDCVCIGWRTLHVILGDSEERREAFLAYLASADVRTIERFAQAPIPMGGAAAWILYLAKP